MTSALARETDERFWRQTAYKPGQKLDMSNPNDRKMAKVWLDIYVTAEANLAAGRPMLTEAPWTAFRMALADARIVSALSSLGVGQCGVRAYANVTPQIKDTLLAKLHADGMAITGDNPWDIDTRQYNVKLRASWDPRAQVLKLIVTAGQGGYFGLVACNVIWEKIDTRVRGIVGS